MLANYGLRSLLLLTGCALLPLRASGQFVLSEDGLTVYDSTNNITWLANANLAATNRFGLALCNGSSIGLANCVNGSGSMNYNAAVAWVAAMNTAKYLGHTDWQLPTTPLIDKSCGKVGPTGDSFGFGCTASALASLYNKLGLKSPNTAVPIPANTTGPFSDIQPYLYWSQSTAGPTEGNATFSFATGWVGANTLPNFLYSWPMIPGRLPGAPTGTGSGLQISLDQQTVYDPVTNTTWLANANIAATNAFGFQRCSDPTTPAVCIATDGSMTYESATQLIAAMNAGAYLGQKNWQLPSIASSCPGYSCSGSQNPMGNLYYAQLGLVGGTSVAVPNVSTGPFVNLQPYLYWTCGGASIQSSCSGSGPVANQEWSYSFGSGFQGTDVLTNSLFVTAYFAGNRGSVSTANPCQTSEIVSTLGGDNASRAAIVYDPNQKVCWLANANLASDPNVRSSLGVNGVNPNGSMDYATAQKWVAAMNAYNKGAGYLGHNNWQFPVAALQDDTCATTGTSGGSFGPLCNGSALGSLYYTGLKQSFPTSVAPGFGAVVPPVKGMKASFYWALQNNGGTSGNPTGGQETFSFANGIQGGVTTKDTFYYVLPMIPGPIGTPPSCASALSGVIPYTSGLAAGNAVYDCNTKYTWLANANLAASNNFGIGGNSTIPYASRTLTVPLINGGAMLFDTATRWLQAMNTQQFLGSSAWQLPASSQVMEQFFTDLNIAKGDSRLLWAGNFGPFQNLQPFFYWACQRDPSGNSQSPCTGYAPPDGSSQLQWTFNFDYGFQATSSLVQKYFLMVYYPVATAAPAPTISAVSNAEGGSSTIAPNTWISIFGANLAPAGDSRIWQTADFVNGQMPTQLDGVNVTVNGKSASVYYISPTQINILTAPDALAGPVQVVVNHNGASSASFTAQAQPVSPSFFVFSGGPYVAAVHANGTLIGPASLYPGSTSPAKPGETVLLYANGFGQTAATLVAGSVTQGGVLSPLPQVTIGGNPAAVQFAGLISPGLFQFNVVVPANTSDGDQNISASYSGAATQNGTLLTVKR